MFEKEENMGRYSVASLFAGIGGICKGFETQGASVVWANEIDKYACQTYRTNMKSTVLIEGDIYDIDEKKMLDADIITAGFPCQSFSVAGKQLGFKDARGNLFFEIMRFIRAKQPKAILLENVKNLVSHDDGNTFKIIIESLKEEGYYLKYKVMNTMEYGNIPQNRERIYIIGFRKQDDYNRFVFPNPISLTNRLSDIINCNEKQEDKYYYTEKSKFYDLLNQSIDKQSTVYQLRRVYVRENKKGVCPTLTANMGTGGNNVPIIRDRYGIRKLTPFECFKFQGYKDIVLPTQVSDSQLYKQAGNSVSVPVIERIAKNIISALSGNKLKETVSIDTDYYEDYVQLTLGDILGEAIKEKQKEYTLSA